LLAGYEGDDVARLAAVVERQRRELALARAAADLAAVAAMARGVLMERHGWSAAEAARELADMAAAAGMPGHEMAAAVLRQEPPARPEPAGPEHEPWLADDAVAVVTAERARDGAELVGALAEHLRPRFGAAAVAVWLLDADGALEMFGADGLGGTESSRWRRLPPQFECAEQRVASTGQDLWEPAGLPAEAGRLPAIAPWGRAAARALIALRHKSGARLGVAEVWWPAPRDDFDAAARARLGAVFAGFAEVLGVRLAYDPVGSTAPSPAVFTLLDEIADSALLLRPLRDGEGTLTDFTMMHQSPGYVDPAGRGPGELAGLTLLEAYPLSGSPDGLFARASRVLSTGRAEQVPGAITAPLTGGKDAVAVADLRVAPFFAGVIFTWRKLGDSEELAGLLGNAQRLGRIGGWEENLMTGTVRWTSAAFALFGLDPEQAAPIPTADLHSFVIAADRAAVRRFRQGLLRAREPGVAVFRIVRPGDTAVRQIRVFAEPVLAGEDVVALRGAFQDVSAHYQTQVALAATHDQLVEEHGVALRLQRAIMPPDVPPAAAAGVEVAVRYRPAEQGRLVGGDWYDTLLLPGKDLLLVVGDVTGHGIGAVTGMVAARNALRGLAATGASPAELLRHLNYAACHLTEGIAGTVVCGRYDPDTRVLRWARAGHLPPILARAGTAEALPLPGGVLLGLDPAAEYDEATLQLQGGDTLLLFTDGLIERREGSISDALGDLAKAAAPPAEDAASLADRILSSAVSDTGDDACLVTIRIL